MKNSFEEFEISGSTYEPIGDIFNGGKKVKGADFIALFCGHFVTVSETTMISQRI